MVGVVKEGPWVCEGWDSLLFAAAQECAAGQQASRFPTPPPPPRPPPTPRYLEDDKAARASSSIQSLTLSPSTAPWLHTDLVHRISHGAVPEFLMSCACRGIGCLLVVQPMWALLQGVRRAAAARLGGCSMYELDPNTSTLHRLVPTAEAARPPEGWFDPEEHLPGFRVVDAVAGGAEFSCQGSMQETAAALTAAPQLKGLGPPLVIFYTLLMHASDMGAAWDAAAVRELLLPGVPASVDEVLSSAAAEWGQEEEGDGMDWQARPPLLIEVGSSLNKEDW